MERIGFVGIGLMGHGMAKNLLAKGYPLTFKVHRNRANLADLTAAGAVEVARHARVGRRERHRLLLRHRLAAGRGDHLRRRRAARGSPQGNAGRRSLDQRAAIRPRASAPILPSAASRTSTRRWRARRRKPKKAG